MKYTLLIIWANFKPDLYYSDDREHLESLVKELVSGHSEKKCYIFKNTGPISRRIVECENGEMKYL